MVWSTRRSFKCTNASDSVLGEKFSAFCGFCLGVVFVGAMSACMMLAPDILKAMSRRGQWLAGSSRVEYAACWLPSTRGNLVHLSRELVVSFSGYMFFVSAMTAVTILSRQLGSGRILSKDYGSDLWCCEFGVLGCWAVINAVIQVLSVA